MGQKGKVTGEEEAGGDEGNKRENDNKIQRTDRVGDDIMTAETEHKVEIR